MGDLSRLASSVESAFGIELDVVSGGNSATLDWALSGADTGRITNLRLGEAVLLGREPSHRRPIEGLHTDAVTLVAEVIECQAKPSRPWGDVAQGAFGAVPVAAGTETVEQVLLAVGRQDVDPDGLTAPDGVRILAASSDHLVLDAGRSGCAVGDELAFGVDYSALVRAMTSPFVARDFRPTGRPPR
jgi:predicted amino acid racemase